MADQELILEIKAGTTFRYAVTFYRAARDSDDVEIVPTVPGEPYDFTACVARMDVRAKGPDQSPLVSLTTSNGGITPGENGVVDIVMTAAQTDVLGYDGTKYRTAAVFDIEIEFPDGDVDRPVSGSIVISPSVTRSA